MTPNEVLDAVVDLDRYPIHDLCRATGARLVETCRAQLDADGVCSLPGFVRFDAVQATVAAGDRLQGQAWHANQRHNVYFTELAAAETEHASEPEHPRRRSIRSSQWAVAYDLLPADLPTRTLYESDALLRFLEAVLGTEPLYRSADPLDALEISYFGPGDELGWHFDNSEFSVTLMLREPERGGDFEYHPSIRTDVDENLPAVAAAIDGTVAPRRLPTAPGTLAIFQGRHALHRVSRVEGAVTRMNMVLTFGAEPGMCLSPLTQQLFYGRRVEAAVDTG